MMKNHVSRRFPAMARCSRKAVTGTMRSHPAAPWRVIYIARGERQAQQIEALLRQAGFLMDQKPLGGEDIEIKVLESEAEEARMYLMEQGL